MSVDERVLGVIEAMYGAALDESRWPAALQQLTELTGSQAATFWVLDSSGQPRLPTFLYVNLDSEFIREYLDGIAPLDPTVQYLVRHPQQPIVHDGLVISEREKDRHPYYDWHHRHSDLRFRMVGQVSVAPAVQAGVALHRRRAVGRYEPPDLKRFEALYPHLQRALTIGFRMGTLGTLQQCCAELLDRNPAAVLLLDEGGRIVFANRAAGALHAARDGIRLTRQGIELACRPDQDRLQELMTQALSPLAPPGAGSGILRVMRPSGKRPYVLLVAPVSRRYPALSALRPALSLVITDPEAPSLVPAARLQAAFGLTRAEAGLAALLAEGETLHSASARLGITYGTARARLAVIFEKTETRRQGELLRLLLATLAAS